MVLKPSVMPVKSEAHVMHSQISLELSLATGYSVKKNWGVEEENRKQSNLKTTLLNFPQIPLYQSSCIFTIRPLLCDHEKVN